MNAPALLTLTPAERLILANQYAILEALFPAEGGSYSWKRRIVERDSEYWSLPTELAPPQECNRTEHPSRRRRATGRVNRGGALTPW